MQEVYDFVCVCKSQRFNSDNYRIYMVELKGDKTKFGLSKNDSNEVALVGDMPSLIVGSQYKVKGEKTTHNKYGLQFKAMNVIPDKPTDLESSRVFLESVLTCNQADNLLKAYPDIIDRILTNKQINLNNIKGVGEYTFDIIQRKVIDNFALIEIVEMFNGLISINMINKIYDKYKNANTIKRLIKTDPYKTLINLSRVGFKTADNILLQLDKETKNSNNVFKFDFDLATSETRMWACIKFILDENELSGNTRMGLMDVRKKCGELVPECIDKFVEVVKNKYDDIYINKKHKYMSTMKAFKTEVYIATFLKEMDSNNKIVWNFDTNKYRIIDGSEATKEQMNTLNMMCNNNLGILTAPGGAGKTFSVKNLLKMCDDNEKNYMLCTPTGKSSEVLSIQTNRKSGTIHRQLMYNPSLENPWVLNKENKLKVDLVVVDEFGMVDIYLFKHLLEAIDIRHTKLLLVFDPYQLSSVGCGNIAQDLLSCNSIPTSQLTKIFRYGEGGLMQIVTKIRNGEYFLPSDFRGSKIFGIKKDFAYMEINEDNNKTLKQVTQIFFKLLNDGYTLDDIVVLVSQNKGNLGTKAVNEYIQKIFQKGKKNHFLMRGSDKFFLGDKVIQIKNNYKAPYPKEWYEKTGKKDETQQVFNGNTGIITKVYFDRLIVDFNGTQVEYKKHDLGQLELGYCITIHKAQGSQARQVIAIAPKAHTFMLNSNLLYVAASRARERVFLFGNIATINRAIKIKENLKRDTWLVDLITNHIEISEYEETARKDVYYKKNPIQSIANSKDMDFLFDGMPF